MSLAANLADLARSFLGTAGNQSVAASGYQKLPSGLIIQWGVNNATTGGSAVTFPLAFPNACFAVIPGSNSTANNPAAVGFSTSGFTFYVNTGSSTAHSWIAIGH